MKKFICGSDLEKTDSSSLSSHTLHSSLNQGKGLVRFFPSHWPINWYSWVQLLCHILEDTILQQTCWSSGSCNLSAPSSVISTDPLVLGFFIVNAAIYFEYPMVNCSLNFDQLCLFVMVFVCCKKKLPWWGLRTMLIYGYKEKYSACS